jgi:uncharacterized integral membrane protein
MGETTEYQPLTQRDKVTVVIYRAGIVLAALSLAAGGFLLTSGSPDTALMNALLILLHVSVGLSVFFIHLYVSKFHRVLKALFAVAVLALALLFASGGPAGAIARQPAFAMLLLPLAGCLGFIAAKEAFCFRLMEGYILALAMPLYLVLVSSGGATSRSAGYGLLAIAALLVLFLLRKVFQPLHYDIGDKSAYV